MDKVDGIEMPTEFDSLKSLLKRKKHINGETQYGFVIINKSINGCITVSVFGKDEVNTKFKVSPKSEISITTQKMAKLEPSHDGLIGQNLTPKFSLPDVLFGFKQQSN